MKLQKLIDAGLYIDEDGVRQPEEIDKHKINRLLNWGGIKLYDLETDPIQDNYDGTEKMRNLTLISDFAKLVKKFPDVIVTMPPRYATILNRILQDNLGKKYPNAISDEGVIEQASDYSVTKIIKTQYEFKSWIKVKKEMPMHELYVDYLNIPASASWINSFFDVDNKSDAMFRFTAPDTNYRIGFLFNGQIVSIKLESDITADNIIEMSCWANSNLGDIVDTAKVCKEIEEQEEAEEPESSTRYQCTR
jgi:hypothetical protein